MITSLAVARRYIPNVNVTDTGADGELVEALRAAEQRFEDMAGFRFVPWIGVNTLSRIYRYNMTGESGRLLYLPFPLLSVTSIVNGDTTLDSEDYDLELVDQRYPSGPYHLIRLTDGSTWVGDATFSSLPQVTLTGSWGFARNLVANWKAAGTLDANALIDATTLTVSDTTADGPDGEAPWISRESLIKINDEAMLVKTVPDGTSVTVERAQLGTTATAHTSVDPIYTWFAEPDVIRAVARWAILLFSRRGAFEEAQAVPGIGIIHYPVDVPRESWHVISRYREMFDNVGGAV